MSRSVDRAVEALIRERAIKGTQFLGCIKRGGACGKGRSAGGYDRAGVRLGDARQGWMRNLGKWGCPVTRPHSRMC